MKNVNDMKQSEIELDMQNFCKWLKEAKGITKIDLIEAIEDYFDEYEQTKISAD